MDDSEKNPSEIRSINQQTSPFPSRREGEV